MRNQKFIVLYYDLSCTCTVISLFIACRRGNTQHERQSSSQHSFTWSIMGSKDGPIRANHQRKLEEKLESNIRGWVDLCWQRTEGARSGHTYSICADMRMKPVWTLNQWDHLNDHRSQLTNNRPEKRLRAQPCLCLAMGSKSFYAAW